MPPKPTYTQKATAKDAHKYDFVAARPPGKRTTDLESVGHLIKSCLGGGIVGIHEAYKAVGMWSAVTLNVFLGFLVAYAMMALAHSAQKIYGRVRVPTMSYPDLAEAALDISPIAGLRKYAKTFRYMVDATIVIDLFGSCCCYQVIIARTLQQLYEYAMTPPEWLNIRVWLVFLIIPCIAIGMILTLKYLAPFSLVADGFIILVVVSTITYGTMHAEKSPFEFEVIKTAGGLFEFLGVCVFSMEGVGATLPIENNMIHPRHISKVLYIGMSVVVLLVMLVGFFGYWGYGEEAKAPVTVNFGLDPWSTFLKFSMAIIIYVTFALNFWIPFNLVWYYLKKRHAEKDHWYVERIYRAIFIIGISIIAIIFPEVSKLMGLLGAFCLSNMGFIYPAFIEFLLDYDDPGFGFMKWRLLRFLFLTIFGLTLMILGTYYNGKELLMLLPFFAKNEDSTPPAS